MARDIITLLCYWNGRIVSGPRGISYEGATPKPIKVSNRLNYIDLMDKMYTVTGFNKQHTCIKVTCRYPSNFQDYIALPIEDDDTVSVVFDVTKRPEISCIEFFLEMFPVKTQHSPNVPLLKYPNTFTQLLTQELGFLDHDFDLNNDEFGEEQFRRDVIPSNDNFIEGQRHRHLSVAIENCHLPNASTSTGSVSNISRCPIEEVVACEANRYVINGIQINNDLLEEIIEETGGGMNEEDIVMIYEDAPGDEFTNIDRINDAVADVVIPRQESCKPNDSGELYVGQRFNSKDELQTAVKVYSLKAHQQYQVLHSSRKLWELKCKLAPSCAWKLRASTPRGVSFFEIKTYTGPHTCVNPIINRDHVQLDSEFVCCQIKSLVKAQLSLTLTAIQAFISDRFAYEISKTKAWNAKQKAIVSLFGDWKESYKILPRYMNVLMQENPGTIVQWDKEGAERNPGHETFRRVFWSFAASIEGFKYCRPIISIDGTHLYGKYKGTMLIAVSCDANNQLFPLAFAVVEGENNDSWAWFMACIRRFVTQRDGICVISDRHIGIRNAMNTYGSGWTEPRAYHRYCIRHLASNFNNKFHDKTLKNLLWWAANENQIRKFEKRMETIEKLNPEARKWLDAIPKEKWALAHDGGRRYGIMTTNLSEVFNSVLKGARCLPITSLVQLTFYRVNSYFTIRRQLGAERIASGNNFTPFVDAKIISNGVKASRHEVILFNRSAGTFSIRTGRSVTNNRKGNNVQIVKLKENFCSCQKWQIMGFPCSHVMAACQSCCLDYTTLVQKWYSITTYEMSWKPQFHPIPDQAYWPAPGEMILVPCDSMKRTKKGRPKSTRLHNEMDVRESRGSVRCSTCKEEGHNKKTCLKQN
ncbi:hypothetical protein OROGR_003967 [Orobanche gracilis]